MTLVHCLTKENIENAVLRVSDKVGETSKTPRKWDNSSEDELFCELVACILGSRVKYETARDCLKALETKDLINISCLIKKPKLTEKRIIMELRKNGYIYAKSKSNFIIRTANEIYNSKRTTIKKLLKSCTDEFEARDLLVDICKGIGPKQASLFLRNIGYTKKLAILDSHVIRYMELQGLQQKINNSLTKSQYFNYEKKLVSYANSLNRSLSALDVGIWIVMRVVQREFKWA